jgi:hypothetical protein
MPLPTPSAGEDQNKFISRCMSSEAMKKEFPEHKQRTAVCFSQWRKGKKMFQVTAPVTKSWEEEVEIKSGEKSTQRFIEVTVSGLREDRDGERMSKEAILNMMEQFKSGTIPFFPDHGRDPSTGQPNVYSWKQIMGVWVDAKQVGDSLKAVVRLNKSHPDSELFFKYIEEGMPIGFSIGGKPAEEPTILEEEFEDGKEET